MRVSGKKVKKFRSFLALLLSVVLVTELVPETVVAKTAAENGVKEQAAETKSNAGTSRALLDKGEEAVWSSVSDGTAEDVNKLIPEKWKGLRYAVFTGSTQDLAFYNQSTSISGDVHSNSGFVYYGSKLYVDGNLETAGKITTGTSENGLFIANPKEGVANTDMPDITGELEKHIKNEGQLLTGNQNFDGEEVTLDDSIYIDGSAAFHSTSFLGKGIIYAESSISYSVGQISTPDESRILLCSEIGDITLNGSDITMNAVIYAPHGCVYVNASTFTLYGRIIADRICINGSMISINAGYTDFDMLDFLFMPEVELTALGNYKENRKVVLNVNEIHNTENLIKEETEWTVTKEDGTSAEGLYALDTENSDGFHREMIFRKAGTYLITSVVTNGNVSVESQIEVVIAEDISPEAGFDVQHYFQRDKNGQAVITFTDNSLSPDGDAIGQRIWYVYYDENNDGIFQENEKTVLDEANKEMIEYTTSGVGTYKAELWVKETFTDTIKSLLLEDAYKSDDTSEEAVEVKTFEVGNQPPEARLDIVKSKSADIVFTVGSADDEMLDSYSSKIEEIKQKLKDSGIDANVSTVSSSVLTAKDTFAWEEFNHFNLDGYDTHIVYDGSDILMRGYYYTAYKDFLYVADENDNQKVFEFDLQRDGTDWHSMEGGGFLFNTTVSEEDNTIKGFCVLVTREGLILDSINCNNLKGFRNGSYSYVQNAGKRLTKVNLSDLYESHHLKIVADSRTVSIWDGDNLILDSFVLPESDSGFGYGPIISHLSHSCWQRSYFTFKNITMRTVTGSTLSDIVDNYEWRQGSAHYVVHLSNQLVPELNTQEKTAGVAKALLENDTPFILLGNDTNQTQGNALLSMAGTGGMCLSGENLMSDMDAVESYLLDSILSKEYTIKENDMVTTEDFIDYIGYYSDPENDEKYKEQWEYEYDPSVFCESSKETERIVRDENAPIRQFENTGAYSIKLRVQDNPAGDNEALNEYRLWSEEKQYEKLLLVQSKPVAKVSVTALKDKTESRVCTANIVYESYDVDHPSDSKKGIREEYFYYKKCSDTEWTEGKLPNKLTIGETYLVKYVVKDIEGSYSKPAVAIVATNGLLEYEEQEDMESPVIELTVSKEKAGVGEEIRIDAYATDDKGVEKFSLYVDGEQMLDHTGRIFYTAAKEGIVTIKAAAEDGSGKQAELVKAVTIYDNRDKTAPEAQITSPVSGSEIGFNVQLLGTAKDETEFDSYTLSYREIGESEYTVFYESNTEVDQGILGELDMSQFNNGTYEILLCVKDKAGNVSYTGIQIEIKSYQQVEESHLYVSLDQAVMSEDKTSIDIYATIQADAGVQEYTLEYVKDGSNEKTVLATGEESLTSEKAGVIQTEGLEVGTYYLSLHVKDTAGNEVCATGSFTYTLEMQTIELDTDREAPEISFEQPQLTEAGDFINILGTVKDNAQLEGYTVTYKVSAAGETVIIGEGCNPVEKEVVGTIATEGLESGDYIVVLTAKDTAGNISTGTMIVTYTKGSTENSVSSQVIDGGISKKNQIKLVLSKNQASVGENVNVQVTLSNEIKERPVVLTVDGDQLEMTDNQAVFTSEKAGKLEVTASVLLENGETLSSTCICQFYVADDDTLPVVELVLPEGDSVLTEPADIIGTAYDEQELLYYELEYRMQGDNDFQQLVQSSEPKRSEVLGTLDTTMLLNGTYEVRLTAVDAGGNMNQVTRKYIVEGDLKVGNINVGFTDIIAKMGATTVNVNRTFDSRNKQKGDFGIGWTLGMQSMTLTETNPIFEGFDLVKSGSLFSTNYSVQETISHDIVIAYGDGTTDRFKVALTPDRQGLVPISEVKVGYRCVSNPDLKLEILGDNLAYVYGSGLIWIDTAVFDREVDYKLTMEDGTEVYLNANDGVRSIKDTLGNIIKVTDNGYESSNGKSILFKRDSEDRIIEASDPNGNVIRYTYDVNGDLHSVTDSANRTVTYEYDTKHNLIAIIDPMGVAAARNEYDENGRLIAVYDADGNKTEYTYDLTGNAQTIKDRNGNTTVYYYDGNGNITSIVDAYGNVTKQTFDEAGNRTSETDALNHTTIYQYDSSSNLIGVTGADGKHVNNSYNEKNLITSINNGDTTLMAMEYDEFGELTSLEDANGNKTEYTYSLKGNLTSITDSIGDYQKMTYDSDGNVLTTTNGAGETASYTYDDDGRCLSVTIARTEDGEEKTFTSFYSYDDAGNVIQSVDNAGNATKYAYDANGNKTSSTDAKNRVTTYQYDSSGNMTSVQYPDGTTETFTYDNMDNNLTATDRFGQTVTMTYDKLNRMTSKKYADGTEERYTYDAVGNVLSYQSTSGAITKYEYDEMNRNTAIIDNDGNKTQFAYDSQGRLETVTDANGGKITYGYDANGNKTEITYADGNAVKSAYDARGRITSQTDQNGNETLYTYDGADRLIKVTDPYGNSYEYIYNANGSLTAVTDANGNTTAYEYDAVGRVSRVTNAAGDVMEFQYDSMGNVTESKDYSGTVTVYSYDENDRLTAKTVGDNTTTYTYTVYGLVKTVSDASGTITYDYDSLSRLTGKTDASGNTVTYAYDECGRLKTLGTEKGTTTYEYDEMDRLTRVIDRNGKATVYEYDKVGNRTAVKYANGVTISYVYDACNRLKEEWVTDKDSNVITSYLYTVGKAGERLKTEETDADGTTVTEYAYDKLNRLVEETVTKDEDSLTNVYEYDKASNRTKKKTTVTGDVMAFVDITSEEIDFVRGTTAYSYNVLNQLVKEQRPSETITYSYDKNGNLVSKAGTESYTYVYDLENHLTRATVQKGNSVTIESYTYDYEGNRTSKTVNESDVTKYVVDTSQMLSQVLFTTDGTGDEKAFYTRGDELLCMEQDGVVSYYVSDGHGSIRALVNADGTVTDTYDYDAYGNLLRKTGTTENDYRYCDEEYNETTGLYYLRARYMDPSTGTFISMDSYSGNMADPVSLHKYLYANANPVTYSDPTGYFSLAECSVCQAIQSTLNSIHQIALLKNIVKWANIMCTVYDTAMEIRSVILGGGSIVDVIGALLKGVVVGFLVDGMCKTSLGIILKPIMAIFGLGSQVDQIQEAIESGDPAEIAVRFVQMACMLFGLTSQCFTEDTLVDTEDGLRPIEEVEEGDYVWSENTETGEKELRKVLSVSVTKTMKLVHVWIGEEEIKTTEYHPFYVIGEGWKAAGELKNGDVLRTSCGENITVTFMEEERLSHAAKVYNLEIEGSHTYYVGCAKVLVHNSCESDIINETSKHKNFECVETAKEVKSIILKAGGKGYIVEINSDLDYIWSDTFNMNISTNGYHVGIEYNGKIYDNIFKNGIDVDLWLQDLVHTYGTKITKTEF